MRNDRTYLAHIRDAIETIAEYIGVNKRIVWDTCKNDLPRFGELVQAALNE